MSDSKTMTKDELARAIVMSAQSVYAAEAIGSREANAARERHDALLRQYEDVLGGIGGRSDPVKASVAPSGIPWCVDRCDAYGRLLPGR